MVLTLVRPFRAILEPVSLHREVAVGQSGREATNETADKTLLPEGKRDDRT
jgi:hypothetical protein